MGLLMLSTALDYAYGFWVASPNRKKAKLFLWLSIINNLGILGVFKYYNFFAVQFQKGFDLLGLHTSPVLLQVALPIGNATCKRTGLECRPSKSNPFWN